MEHMSLKDLSKEIVLCERMLEWHLSIAQQYKELLARKKELILLIKENCTHQDQNGEVCNYCGKYLNSVEINYQDVLFLDNDSRYNEYYKMNVAKNKDKKYFEHNGWIYEVGETPIRRSRTSEFLMGNK